MTISHTALIEAYAYDPGTGLFTNRRTGRVLGSLTKDGYLRFKPQGADRSYPCHRLAWFYVYGEWPAAGLDHINGVRTDNRIANLREATHPENLQNQHRARSDNRVDLIGANFHSPSNRWRSQIKVNGVKIHLGYFDSAYEAHLAYLSAKRKYHPFGEIAKLPDWLLN